MKKPMRIKNISSDRVVILGVGVIKPNEIREIPKKVWKLLHKPWPQSKISATEFYRCEDIDFLVEVDKKGEPIKPIEKIAEKKQKPPTVPTQPSPRYHGTKEVLKREKA